MIDTKIISLTAKMGLPVLLPLGVISFCRYYNEWKLIETVGASLCVMVTLYFTKQIFQAIYTTWIGPLLGHNIDLKSMGDWAVITGATDGIGKAYARELANRGINLVLISRTENKLETVAMELETEFSILTEIIAVDFTKGLEIYDAIWDKLKLMDLDIGVLINNVGMAYTSPELFLDIPDVEKFTQSIINCNILSATMMTRLVLPGMVEQGKGVVINVGSVSSTIQVPYMTLYGATKAYLEKFTVDMSLEYKNKGIIFQYLYPSYVTTSLSKIKQSSWHIPNPEDFVKVAIKTIGLQEKTAVWLPHRLLCFCIRCCQIIRPDNIPTICYEGMKGVWLYGKKIQMIKAKKMQSMQACQ